MNKLAEMAWPGGDKPLNSFSGTISPAKSKILVSILDKYFNINSVIGLKLVSPSDEDSLIGRYRVITDKKDYFFRISTKIGNADLEKKLIDFLFNQGVFVNRIIDSKLIKSEENFLRADLRGYLEGFFFCGNPEQIKSSGREIKKLHNSLRAFSYKNEILKIAESRYKELLKVKEKIASSYTSGNFDWLCPEYVEWIDKNNNFINHYLNCFDCCDINQSSASLIHGELHLGNILFLDDSTPVILDFEESVQSFASNQWDISFFILRFLMKDNPDNYTFFERLEEFKKGYGDISLSFCEVIKQISFFSLTIIFKRWIDGIYTPLFELEKFRNFYIQADRIEEFIKLDQRKEVVKNKVPETQVWKTA